MGYPSRAGGTGYYLSYASCRLGRITGRIIPAPIHKWERPRWGPDPSIFSQTQGQSSYSGTSYPRTHQCNYLPIFNPFRGTNHRGLTKPIIIWFNNPGLTNPNHSPFLCSIFYVNQSLFCDCPARSISFRFRPSSNWINGMTHCRKAAFYVMLASLWIYEYMNGPGSPYLCRRAPVGAVPA